MEFKFSCKWFEIAFSGDPGFVEAQLEKYEPYVLKMLARIEEESEADKKKPGKEPEVKAPEESPAAPAQPHGRRHRNRDRRHREEGAKNHNPPPHNPSSGASGHAHRLPHNQTRSGFTNPGPEKAVEKVADTGPFNWSQEALPLLPFHGPEPQPSENTPEAPVPSPEIEPSPDPQALPVPSSEFPRRRQAPVIRADDLQKIMGAKKPRTHHDRVMVFGYYMEHEGDGSDFTIAEIKKCYQAVDQEAGMNIEQVINHATRSGFIIRSDAGRTARFKLSNKGRRYVEDGLKLA